TRGQSLAYAEQSRMLESEFARHLVAEPPLRVPGIAVYLTRVAGTVPRTLLHNLTHNHVLHEQVVLVTVITEHIPRVATGQRTHVQPDTAELTSIVVRYGYLERPNLPRILQAAKVPGIGFEPEVTSYFLTRMRIVVTRRGDMMRWRKRLYAILVNNALSAT